MLYLSIQHQRTEQKMAKELWLVVPQNSFLSRRSARTMILNIFMNKYLSFFLLLIEAA